MLSTVNRPLSTIHRPPSTVHNSLTIKPKHMSSLLQRLQTDGPKRILALDGGGIRGALTLGYLQGIEDTLRKQHDNDPAFRLSDYFDLIGGTSTGSIIASCLAIGMK